MCYFQGKKSVSAAPQISNPFEGESTNPFEGDTDNEDVKTTTDDSKVISL